MAGHALTLDFLRDMRVTAPEPKKHNTTGAIRPTFFRGATWPEDAPVEAVPVEKAVVKQKPPKKRAQAAETMPGVEKVRFTKKEAAWSLGICLRSLNYRIQAGKIHTKRDGDGVFITASELKRYNKSDHTEAFRTRPPNNASG